MRKSNGFTLVELMVTMVVIGILATLVLAAISRAQESANQSQTKSTILKLHEIIANRWDTYRHRRIPVGTDQRQYNAADDRVYVYRLDAYEAAIYRTKVIRKQQRMELPDRWGDIKTVQTNYDIDGQGNTPYNVASHPIEGLRWRNVNQPDAATVDIPVPVPIPALYYAYQTYYKTVSVTADQPTRTPTAVYEGAECLYMIVKVGGVDENDSLSSFSEQEVGDVDGDGAPEFLDAWGTPIGFIRWPVGFVDDPRQDLSDDSDWHFGHLSDIQPSKQPQGVSNPLLEECRCDSRRRHDPFDPRQTDRFAFETFPLIYSAGPNRKYDIYHGVSDRDALVDHGGVPNPPDRYAEPLTLKVASGNASNLDTLDDPYVEIRTNSSPCDTYNPLFELVDQDVEGSGVRPRSSGIPKDLKNEPAYVANQGWIWQSDIADSRLSHYDNLHNHILDTRLR